MKQKIFLIIFSIILFFPAVLFAADGDMSGDDDIIFKAQIIEILENNEVERDDGSISIQQKIKLKGLEKKWKDEIVIFDGTKFDVLSAVTYEKGDKVIVSQTFNPDNEEEFYIIGFVRTKYIYLLALLFAFAVIAIGRLKGLRALVVLFLTFVIILKFIIPQILAGYSPLFISIIGSLFILVLSVYITEGFKKTSSIAILSILISLFLTGLLSVWFTTVTKLSGFVSEDAMYLVGSAGGNINIQGLLLAGIIIGALGVLDDVVISQVMLVKELKISNQQLSNKQIYKKAMKVGVSHLSSMVNTLFLAYAGAALPLLILFSIDQTPSLQFSEIINNEIIATEIVRTMTGSIGLVLAVPIATFLAVKFIYTKKKIV